MTSCAVPLVFLFLDTEFTSLAKPELISLGISASDGSEFYFERTDYPASRCTPFVRSEVLPKLGWDWGAQATRAEGSARLIAWLQARGTVLLIPVYDYVDDLRLFMQLVPSDWHSNLAPIDARWDMSDAMLEEYFSRPGVLRHHALHDARALAHACGPWATRLRGEFHRVHLKLASLGAERQLAFWRQDLGGNHPLRAINEGLIDEVDRLADSARNLDLRSSGKS